MNILSAEEMKEAQKLFSSIPIDPLYKLRLPTDKEYKKISTFQPHMLPPASPAIQKITQKLISLSDNMRSLSLNQPNSIFHMVVYTLMNILYQDKFNSTTDSQNSVYLLQTIKCSLYSKDVDLKVIRNVPANYQTKYLKLMIYQFFAFMHQPSLTIKTSRSKCAQWILTYNPILMIAFTLFLRFILVKIGIELADDYRKCVDNEQGVSNLIEYFDLHYRSFGELILFYEDGIFLAMIERQMVVGEYYQNESEKQSQKQHLQIKQSVKLNMIESFLVNLNDKPQKTQLSQSIRDNKKKGIVQSDMELFNFMLQSSTQDATQNIIKMKQSEMETPHFKDGSCQFQFLRKNKSEQVRNQFKKLIIGQSQQYIKEDDIALTPYVGGQNQLAFIANSNSFAYKLHNLPLIIDSPIGELNTSKICQNPFELIATSKVQCSWKRSDVGSCGCRRLRSMRNNMDSKVVEISVLPLKSRGQYYTTSRAHPRYPISYRANQQTKKRQQQKTKQAFKQYNSFNSKIKDKNNMERKPAFLKNLKKNKAQTIAQDFTKLRVSQTKAYNPYNIQKQVSHQNINSFPQYIKISQVKTSQISTPNAGVSSMSPLNFFAPVQILAPTVYVNSNDGRSNSNIVLKMNDMKGRVWANPQANGSKKQLVNRLRYNAKQF